MGLRGEGGCWAGENWDGPMNERLRDTLTGLVTSRKELRFGSCELGDLTSAIENLYIRVGRIMIMMYVCTVPTDALPEHDRTNDARGLQDCYVLP